MRNKRHVQLTLGQIEAVQQSFIQFIRNTSLSEGERVFLEKQIEVSKQAFEQIRTYLNQEEEEYNTASFPNPQDNINYGIKSGRF
jgi:uncharacterized membrane protein YgaE (UPF0421/DUF939 family)